jgi:hypothetical protein
VRAIIGTRARQLPGARVGVGEVVLGEEQHVHPEQVPLRARPLARRDLPSASIART